MKIVMTLLVIVCVFAVAILSLAAYLSIKYHRVNPELRFLGWLFDIVSRFDTVDGLREFTAKQNKTTRELARDEAVDTEEVIIKGRDGKELSLIIYKPKVIREDAIGLLWMHGGGYAMGSARTDLNSVKKFILEANTVAVCPDYTLSVIEPYPAALYDCYDALLWMKNNAEKLGVNPAQLFVGGGSAGGGLAAAVALYARDLGEVQIAFQMPLCPMINDKMDTKSMIGNKELIWNEARSRAAWQVYLGDLYGTEQVPKYAAVMRETDFSNMPPAYSQVGDLDPFYDDTLNYIKALQDCGIKASCDVFQGAYHGFEIAQGKLTRQARQKLMEVYQFAAEHYFAPQKDY